MDRSAPPSEFEGRALSGAFGIVVAAPSFDLLAGVTQRAEPVQIEALVAQLAVQALDEGVLDRLARLVPSGPLSRTISSGRPCSSTRSSRCRATLAPEIETSTIWPGRNRLWSSTMFSTRKRQQSASWWLMKSSGQRCIGRSGTCGATRSRRGSLRRVFVRTCRPSSA